MAVVIPPGYALASYRFSLAGDNEEMVVTLGFDFAGDGQTVAEDIANRFGAHFTSAWMVPEYRFKGVRLAVGQDGGTAAIYIAERNAVGTNGSGAPLPQNVAILLRKVTALGGRQHRGRMYLPPFFPTENNITAQGNLVGTDAADISARANLAFRPPGRNPHILHDQAPGAPAVAPTPIVTFVCDGRVATQRRRLRR